MPPRNKRASASKSDERPSAGKRMKTDSASDAKSSKVDIYEQYKDMAT
jgi:hypothetical protein